VASAGIRTSSLGACGCLWSAALVGDTDVKALPGMGAPVPGFRGRRDLARRSGAPGVTRLLAARSHSSSPAEPRARRAQSKAGADPERRASDGDRALARQLERASPVTSRIGPTAHDGRHDGKRIALSEERGYERGYGDDPSQPVATSPNPSSGCRGLWKRESPRVERDFGVWRAKEMVDRGRIEPESGVELVTGDDA
jgi:hypothetical protein